MKIENVETGDAKELLELYLPYVTETAITFEYEVPTEADFTERIRTITKRYPYIKAVENGKILGYAYAGRFKDREAYNWSVETTIYVKKDCRKKGIGRALYNRLEMELKKIGILNMNACIGVPIKESRYLNNDSYEFHKKMGFDLVGRFHYSGYKFGEWYDMIWMEKLIGTHEWNIK